MSFRFFHLQEKFPCFFHMMIMLDFVFVMLLSLDVGLTLFLLGWQQFIRKRTNVALLVLLVFSVGGLILQASDPHTDESTMIIELSKNVLRMTRVFVFWRKLKVVLNSPLSQWDVHDDILKSPYVSEHQPD